MPNLKSARKALRVAAHRREVNDRWRAKLRAAYKDLRLAVTAKDKAKADTAYVEVTSILDRAARRNIVHPNKASRKKSRLAKAVANITA